MFLQDIREVGVPELDQTDENKLNKRLLYQNRIQNDLRKRFRVEYLGQLRETRNIKGENTLSEGDIVLVGDDHTKRLNWNLGKILKLYPGKDKKMLMKEVIYLFSIFYGETSGHQLETGSLINIDPELSKPQRAAPLRCRPVLRCSPVPVFLMVELDWSPELRQVDTSRQKPLRCSPVPVFLMWEPEWSLDLRPLNCQMS
ncbi:integrase catalytic domain-containing protein [Trichonephila clavipes]|nr:integrase catalytic domain-containing protein [Trichonephila clavipes]